jgi:hypothetical protein
MAPRVKEGNREQPRSIRPFEPAPTRKESVGPQFAEEHATAVTPRPLRRKALETYPQHTERESDVDNRPEARIPQQEPEARTPNGGKMKANGQPVAVRTHQRRRKTKANPRR